MSTTRRTFIEQSASLALGVTAAPGVLCAAAPAPAASPAAAPAAAPPARSSLVIVYLRGGADALSAVVPYADALYKQHRPVLAIPGPDDKAAAKALPLDKTFAFNPHMGPLHALYAKGLCAPMVCVGSPHPTRSHFEAQDYMERAAPGLRHINDGWLNRYLQASRTASDAPLRALALQSTLVRSLRGAYPVLAVPPRTSADASMKTFENMYAGGAPTMAPLDVRGQQTHDAIRHAGANTIVQLRQLNELLAQPDSQTKYPDSHFARQMRDVAKLIKANRGLEITALDYHGWDHHIDQGVVDGPFGKMMGDISGVLASFVEDLGPRMDRVLVLVMSEFGRTVMQNGTRGTDHGRGAFMLAVGGMVNGGKVYGQWTGLEVKNLVDQRDLPVHTDFRLVFGETLRDLFGFDAAREGYFPQYTSSAPLLDFLRPLA